MTVLFVLGWILCGCPTGLLTFDCVLGKYKQDDICKTCPRSCSRCISDVICIACKPGFYGDICKEKCSESCSDGKCLQENGQCVSCAVGHYFSHNKTCVKCPEHCTHCQSQDLCTACKIGFTGIKCQEECTNCNPVSGCNIETNVCFAGCKDGYSDPTCVKHCASKCKSCEPVDASKCTSCAYGRYGANCDKTCPTMCRDFRCNDDNGDCTHECKDGFWGNKCENTCSRNCRQGICHQSNGSCLNGCHGNFTGSMCRCPSDCECTSDDTCEKCSKDSSFVCDKQCSIFCIGSICSFDKHQKCLYGCREGYRGIICGSQIQTNVVLITILVMIVVIITVTVVVIIMLRKRREELVCGRSGNYKSAESDVPEEMKMITRETAYAKSDCKKISVDWKVNSKEKIVHAPKTDSANPRSSRSKLKSNSLMCCVKREGKEGQKERSKLGKKTYTKCAKKYEIRSERQHKLHTLAQSIKKKKDKDYQTEWENIPKMFSTLSMECKDEISPGSLEAKGIGPYEFNKVSVKGATRSHYFNASYIVEIERTEPTYIACIGPNTEYKKCFDLFWRMVWNTNCHMIVMLNAVKQENNEQYWPPTYQPYLYSRINVTLTEEQEEENYVLRRFEIREEGTEVRHVTQIQYKAWPEKERARNMESFLEFFKTMHIETSKTSGPIIVHGRAGVGRTGTFIALDLLRREAEVLLDSVEKVDEKRVNIRACVEHLRTQRVNMVETVEQYKFLHEAFAQVIFSMLEEMGYQDDTPV